jgi:rod shape-determining protein MreC
MESFFSRNRNVLVLVAVLLAQVIGLAVQVRAPGEEGSDRGGERLIRAWVVGVVGPPERLLHGTGLGIRSLWANYIDLIHVRQQDQSLRAHMDQLRLEEASLAEDARQDLRLQALLGFQQKYIYKTIAAQVIGTAGTEQSHVLFIDKGSDNGLAPDMPVITPDGIVGKTRDVFDHISQVLEISDATSGAGVILQQTRIQGVLRGNSWGQPEIVNVSPDERIKAGEPVLTSGGDSIYPRGLPVGSVDRVVPDPDGTLVSVLVKPAANLARLEEVLIITSTGAQMPDQMQDDLSQAQQRAADILAERLPSRADPNAPASPAAAQGQTQANGAQTGTNPNLGLPTPPPKPPPPLHADHFSSSSVPPATAMIPGQRLANTETEPSASGPAQPPTAQPPVRSRSTATGVADTTGARPAEASATAKKADTGAAGQEAPAGAAPGARATATTEKTEATGTTNGNVPARSSSQPHPTGPAGAHADDGTAGRATPGSAKPTTANPGGAVPNGAHGQADRSQTAEPATAQPRSTQPQATQPQARD